MLTNKLMLCEMVRTGGTMMRGLLRKVPGLEIWDPVKWGQHTSRAKMRRYCKEQGYPVPPSAIFKRHPYSWYLSCWCYHAHLDLPDISFPEFLTWQSGIPGQAPWPQWTWSSMWVNLGGAQAEYIFPFENLYGSIRHLLALTMPDLISDGEVRSLLAGQVVSRASRVPPYGEWLEGYDPMHFYDEELKQRIRDQDGILAERLGYEL